LRDLLAELNSASLLNAGLLNRNELPFELREFGSHRPVASDEECRRPEHNHGNAGRYGIIRSLLVLGSRKLRRP
jgi:hypothetical protein